MDVLRKKYPKWAHRRNARKKQRHKRRRSRSRSRSRSRRRRKRGHHSNAGFDGTTTDTLLVSLLQQLLMPQAVARKHGENVLSGLGRRSVRPDHLAPVRSETGIGGRHGEVSRAQREGRLPGAHGGAAGGAAGAAAFLAPVPARG
jgi:hypothetical protein